MGAYYFTGYDGVLWHVTAEGFHIRMASPPRELGETVYTESVGEGITGAVVEYEPDRWHKGAHPELIGTPPDRWDDLTDWTLPVLRPKWEET